MKEMNKKPSRARSQSKSKITHRSYTPIGDALNNPSCFADTELAEAISGNALVGRMKQAIGRKRRCDGTPMSQLLCALLVWPLLSVKSIFCLCEQLTQILQGGLSVVYDFLGREDISWRSLSGQLCKQVSQNNDLGTRAERAFVVDDSIKKRRGRKVEGASCHFDHTESKTVHGHQLLTLGLASPKGFVPVDGQLVMSEVRPVHKPTDKPFQDQRSAAACDMRRSQQTKHQLFRDMLRRAIGLGLAAAYLLADAWFGCKENIALSVELGLTGIFQMKRGNLKYRYQYRDYTAKQLYMKVQRRMRPAHPHARYKTASLLVHINLQSESNQPDHWVLVRLVFSAPVQPSSADSWVIFVCTDPDASETDILKAFSLRWSIEVYFKEVKQNLGLFKEQSGRYQVAYASVHLAAIRYLLLFEAMLRSGGLSYGSVRDRQSGRLQSLTFAVLLWDLFRALIEGALAGLVEKLGEKTIEIVRTAINDTVEEFLTGALQMKPDQIAAQLQAEKLGFL